MRAVATLAALGLLASCGGSGGGAVPRLPRSGGAASEDAPRAGRGKDPWRGRALLPPPEPLAGRRLELPPIHRFTLPNGLAVVVVESHVAPMVSYQLAVRAGRRHERREQVGIAALTASTLMRGTARRSRAQLAAAAEAVSAALSTSASFEVTLFGCSVPSVDQATCGALLGELVGQPGLGAAAVADGKREVIASIRGALGDARELANLHLADVLWGPLNVRGWSTREAVIEQLGAAEVTAWVRERFRPTNAVLMVVGDVEPRALEASLRRSFSGWRKASLPVDPAIIDPKRDGMTIRLVDAPGASNAQVRVGGFGLAHRDPDFAAMTLVNHVLGGSPSSRLSAAVRGKLGPASVASSSFDKNLERGALVVAGGAPSAQAVQLVRIIVDELEAMGARGPSEAELARATSELIGDQAVRFDSIVEVGNAVLGSELHGLGAAELAELPLAIGKVTVKDARAAAARRIDGDRVAVVIVGDGAMIGAALDKAGLRYQKVSVRDPIGPPPGERVGTPAAPADLARATQVLEAALARKGGYERIAGLKTLAWKGEASLTMQGKKLPATVEKRYVLPDRLWLDMVLDGGTIKVTTVLAGERGWARQEQGGQRRLIDFPPAEVAAGASQIWRDPDLALIRHREPGARLAVEADVTVDGAACHAIKVTSGAAAGREMVLLIDKKTSQLRGMRYSEQDQTAEERYGSFQRVSGLEIAHQRSTRSADVDLTTTIRSVQIGKPIDPGLFARPEK